MSQRRASAFLVFVPLLVLAVCLGAPSTAAAKEWESESHNVVLVIPDAPAPWEWLPFHPDYAKAGIIKGARRELTKLKNGKPGDGQGGLLHLVWKDAPKNVTLEQLAEDSSVREFLTKRFAGSEGGIEQETYSVVSGDLKEHPAIILRTEGEAPNLRGKKQKATGVLLVTMAKGKMYLVRMYAFPTEFDEEGISVDLDYMEGNCLELISTKEKAKRPDRPPANGGGEPKPGEPKEPEGKVEVFEDRNQRWRVTKPAKLKAEEVSEDDKKNDMVLRFGDTDAGGGYAIYFYAIPNSRLIDGVQAPPPDLSSWMSKHWWNNFTTNHPKGDIHTWKWPRKTKNGTFLTLPYMEEEKKRKGVITGRKKRPVEITPSEARKMGFIEKVKGKIGKKGKASEAMRGCLEGKRPRYPGQETLWRFAWRNREHSYRLIVTIYNKAYLKWGASIREMLESWEFGVKFPKK